MSAAAKTKADSSPCQNVDFVDLRMGGFCIVIMNIAQVDQGVKPLGSNGLLEVEKLNPQI